MDELMNTVSSDILPVNCTLDMIMTVLNYSLAIEPAVIPNEVTNSLKIFNMYIVHIPAWVHFNLILCIVGKMAKLCTQNS